jgi:hypothetical protein
MAATCVALPHAGFRENAYRRRRILERSKIGLDEFTTARSMQGEKPGSCTEAGNRARYWLHTATVEGNASKPTTRVCKTFLLLLHFYGDYYSFV